MCPGHERRTLSPSSLRHPEEQGLAAVDSSRWRGRGPKKKNRRNRSLHKQEKGRETRHRRRGRRASEGGLQSPVSVTTRREEARNRRQGRDSQSLPRDALRIHDDSDSDSGTSRARRRERGRSKSHGRRARSVERVRVTEVEEQGHYDKQESKIGEERPAQREEAKDSLARDAAEGDMARDEDDVVLPIPSPNLRLPRPRQEWSSTELEKNLDIAAEYRKIRKVPRPESTRESVRSWDKDQETELHQVQEDADEAAQNEYLKMPLLAAVDPVSQREPFHFLTSTEHQEDDESDSGGSQSDGSMSASSVSGFSVVVAPAAAYSGHRPAVLPGPWLKPSQQRVAQGEQENRLWTGGRREEGLSLDLNRR